MMDMTSVDSTKLKTGNFKRLLLWDEAEKEHSNIITIRFRPTYTNYEVRLHQHMTVKDVIIEVCRQAKMSIQDDCYLWFDSNELNINDTVFQAGLCQTSSSITDLPEVRLKYVQTLQTSTHFGKQVFLASSKHIAYNQLLDIPLPSTKNYIVPNVLQTITEQIVRRASSVTQSSQEDGTVFIPLPNFSKQSIDSLPTIQLRVPLSPNEFDWNTLLSHLADDLEIDRTDLIVVSAQAGSTILKVKLRPKVAQVKETVKKVANKLLVMILPKCEQFVTENLPRNTLKANKIQVELKNFAEKQTTEDAANLSPNEIDLALRLSERPAIINDHSWNFMIEKSRQIRTSILQSIQSLSDEYIIDHASIIYNEQIYDQYEKLSDIDKDEKILFHGTRTINFDGIFEKNFQYHAGVKRTDEGWYGQGIYFSSSPKKALNYAKSNSRISYLICSLVRLGKMLTVTDMRFKGKPMHPDYDSHYVPIRTDGDPISQGETPVFEEFVIKTSKQIMPLYVVGVLKVSRFVIWRDAKITNEANSIIFEEMKHKYAFNIYGTQTSVEALDILKSKLTDESMKCVVVTNGADDGEGFTRQCRSIRSSLPIIVYCKNKTYHQQWATRLQRPSVNVTSSPEEVFNLITDILQK
jgi:hypothetical protein